MHHPPSTYLQVLCVAWCIALLAEANPPTCSLSSGSNDCGSRPEPLVEASATSEPKAVLGLC